MDIQEIDINKLIPYHNNPRKDQAVDKVASSINEYGFQQPIVVDKNMVVIVGHTRLMGAKKLGLDKVPTVIANLSETQAKAYRIADNRINEDSTWDIDLLNLEIAGLSDEDYDLDLLGFESEELDKFLINEEEYLTDEDEVPEPPKEPIAKLGDIYQLGEHRLMCGDSTSIDAIDELMENQKADMVFTDPPYNIDYQGIKDKRKIKNDKMEEDNFVDFLTSSLLGCETMYVCCSWQYAHLFRQAMINISRKPKAMIIWDKVNPAQHLDKYFKQHEIIFYYGDFGGHKTLRGDVWKLKRQKNTLHPTMKPVELIEIALQDNLDKKIIYDAFGGSGSTLIACEKTNRKCCMMELDPKYCQVIIDRMKKLDPTLTIKRNGKAI